MAAAGITELAGSVAVVTGAGNGIGAELARQFAAAGLNVVLVDVNEDAVMSRADAITAAGGTCVARLLDVSDPQATDALAAEIARDLGPVRMLVNNAGVELLGRCWEITPQMWERIMRVNVDGPVNMVRSFLPAMARQEESAYIANVCSIGSLISLAIQGAYIASKHALLAYTECLSLDVLDAGYPIKVSAVLPGPVRTGIFDAATVAGSAAGKGHLTQMQDLLNTHGMPVDEAAARIIAGIAAGNFWVSTHPELLAKSAADRAAHLLNR